MNLCGIVAFKSGPSQIAAIKVEVLGGNEIRRDFGLEEQDTPHISCCYKYKGGGYWVGCVVAEIFCVTPAHSSPSFDWF